MSKHIKDPVSALSHLVGAVLSVAGLVLLIVFAASKGSTGDMVSFTIFGTSLILLYTFSTLYHWLNLSDKATSIFRKLDHIMIYVLIAGTYTPILLGPLRGPWGWSLFGVVWGLTLIGTFLTVFWLSAPRWLTTSIYVAMGWVVIIATAPLITVFRENSMLASLLWLLAGGLFYTVGAICYAIKKPNLKNPSWGFHEIFHVFVLLRKLMSFLVRFKICY